jgi:hypothetical protein
MEQRSASVDEAVAIAVAVERFLLETTAVVESAEDVSPWQRAALLEGVGAKRTIEDPEGGMR